MKKILLAMMLAVFLFTLYGCNGGENKVSEEQAGMPYYWYDDPKFADQIVPFDEAKYGSDESYDKSRVKPSPESTPGTLSERIGYIENQWNISFDKDYISDPSIWESVTHKESFKTWLSKYIPYPIRVKDNNESAEDWGIEINAPSEKISEIEATLKSLVDQGLINIALLC